MDFLRGFRLERKLIGMILSLLLAAILWVLPLPGDLGLAGRKMLIVTLCEGHETALYRGLGGGRFEPAG